MNLTKSRYFSINQFSVTLVRIVPILPIFIYLTEDKNKTKKLNEGKTFYLTG